MSSYLLRVGALCLSLVATVWAQSCLAMSYDVRGEYESWNSGLGGTARGLLGGVGVSHPLNEKIVLGGGLVAGSFSTDSVTGRKVKRLDLDASASYVWKPNLSIFVGYQLIQLGVDVESDSNRSFDDQLQALGVGISYYLPLRPKWFVYANASGSGVYAQSSLVSGVDQGTGISSSFSGGLFYTFSYKTTLGFGFKTRLTDVNYGGESGHWSHNAVRATASLSHAL